MGVPHSFTGNPGLTWMWISYPQMLQENWQWQSFSLSAWSPPHQVPRPVPFPRHSFCSINKQHKNASAFSRWVQDVCESSEIDYKKKRVNKTEPWTLNPQPLNDSWYKEVLSTWWCKTNYKYLSASDFITTLLVDLLTRFTSAKHKQKQWRSLMSERVSISSHPAEIKQIYYLQKK